MTTLVIFGTGDLTRRYLLPALVELDGAGLLPADLHVVGAGREPMDDAGFRASVAGALGPGGGGVASRLRYVQVDVTRPADVAAVVAAVGARPGADPGIREPVLAYLALPPAVFASAIEGLAPVLPPGSRLAVEKPFGTDLHTARRLNRLLARHLDETRVHRVDHFLGHSTVQNLLGLRFANVVFEPIWNRTWIERVEITWDETVALEGRAGYYDGAGALLDMVQNHLLQLLTLVALEPPATLDERDLRDRKVEVLRAVRRLSAAEVAQRSTRGRYGAGRVGSRDLPAYADEEGVDPRRGTETFVELELAIDTWRWAGVPFVLRTGKALADDAREIRIRFRPVPHLAYGQDEDPVANELRLALDPDEVTLAVNVNGAGERFSVEPAELALSLAPAELSAYATVLHDLLVGDASLAVRADEAEESWRIVEPVLAAWRAGAAPLGTYPAGTTGAGVAELLRARRA